MEQVHLQLSRTSSRPLPHMILNPIVTIFSGLNTPISPFRITIPIP